MATVLKSDRECPPVGVQGATGFNLNDLAAQGQQHVVAAEQRAQQILQQAHDQAEQLRQRTFEDARRAGLAAAEAEVQQRVHATASQLVACQIPQLTAATEALRRAEHEWLTAWQTTTVQLAIDIAEKLIQRELALDPTILSRWLAEAVSHVRAGRQICICVHPETLADRGEELEALVHAADLREAVIQPDESVPVAGIVIRQESGRLELSLTSQLERLGEQLGASPS
jgi:flagellar biosynthesis/type III secretory pathway protein FliH